MRYLLFLLPLLMFSCEDVKVEFVEVSAANLCAIEIPDYMEPIDLGSPGAVLQYGNELKEHYVTVLVETHDQLAANDLHMNLKQYSDYYLNFLKEGLVNPTVEALHEGIKDVNGLKAIGYKVNGMVVGDELDLASYIMFYQSSKGFYYVSTWTLTSREAKFAEYMNKIVYSLIEL